MSKTWVILPVKAFDRAKTRLSSVLASTQRESVARLMATDVLMAFEQEELARRFDCAYENDDPTLDVSANVTRVAQMPEIQSAKTFLLVAADLPSLCSKDFTRILRGHEEGVTICRAVRDGGTNAFIATMPQQVKFSFGAGSAKRHASAARAAGQKVSVLDDAAFQRDIDTPEDLQCLCRQNDSCDTTKFLRGSGVVTRLNDRVAVAETA
jgi:2-phospho-L-lactate guanylyltransferase